MYYVRLEPADEHKQDGAHKTKVPWGVASADAHFHDIGLHPEDPSLHYTLMVPGYAAAELVKAGAKQIGIFEIKDGKFVPAAVTDVSSIDVKQELASAPDHEIRRYLTHHDAHPMHEHKTHLVKKVKDPTTGQRTKTLVPNPIHPTPDELRARAHVINDAKTKI